MSNALKCDRCGVCFDPYSGGDGVEYVSFTNPAFRTAKDLLEMKHGRSWKKYAYPDTMMDLCPSCTRAFEKFMKCDDTPSIPSSKDSIDNRSAKESKSITAYAGYMNYTPDRGCLEVSDDLCAQYNEDLRKIAFCNKRQAEEILEKLREIVETDASVTVLDVYEFIGHPTYYTDCYYGWRDLEHAWIEQCTVTSDYAQIQTTSWYLRFPPIIHLTEPDDEDGDTDGDSDLINDYALRQLCDNTKKEIATDDN